MSRKKITKSLPASGPLTEQEIRANMKAFAAFMARMIEKYGAEVLAEIDAEAAEKQGTENTAAATGKEPTGNTVVTVSAMETAVEAGP